MGYNHAVAAPYISVVVRCYNRVPQLCILLERLLAQDHDSFEVVVVEQSTLVPDDDAARLAELEIDPRLRLLRHPPLGGARARNVGAMAARGEILVLVDDDDLPRGTDWLAAHARNFADPLCLGVSGRQLYDENEPENPYSPLVERIAYRRCMRFSPLLKLPWVCVRHQRRKVPIDYLHGTNSSLRRAAIDRFGGWDEDTVIEDEASFGYRAQRLKRKEEYFAFDPLPVVVRGRDLPGGLDKRYLGGAAYFDQFIGYVHTIIGRYFPWRLRLLYPAYVVAVAVWTNAWIWDDSQLHGRWWRRLGSSVAVTLAAPFLALRALLRHKRNSRR